MKSNKFSLNCMIKNSKINFISLSKYFLGTLALILLSAIIIISVIGLKLGFDFAGGTIIEAVYDVDANGTVYNEEQAKNIIETAIADYDLEVSSYQTEESTFGDRIVFKLISGIKLTDTQLADLKNSIYTMFSSYDAEEIIQSNYIKVYNVQSTANNTAVYASIGLSVAIVMLGLLIWVRYGLSQALTAVITTIINILMVFAFVIICRIPVDTAFISSVLSIFTISTITSLIFFDKVKEDIKNQNNKGLSKAQYSNLALREVFLAQLLIFGISLICMILVSGLGVAPIRNFALPTLFGLIVSSLSVFFSVPFFWTIINIKRKK